MARELTPSKEYIDYICDLYGDFYDDRIEDCKPPIFTECRIGAIFTLEVETVQTLYSYQRVCSFDKMINNVS